MDLLFASIILLATIGGFAIGCGLPFLVLLQYKRVSRLSFLIAITLCSPMTGLGSVVAGLLFGGWAAELLGILGLPMGIFIGCFLGSLLMNSVVVSITFGCCAAVSAFARKLHFPKGEEKGRKGG